MSRRTLAARGSEARRAPVSGAVRAEAGTGVCTVCGAEGHFEQDHKSIREGFRCPHCRASLRYRHQAAVMLDEFAQRRSASFASLVEEPEFRGLTIYEPGIIGPFRKYLRSLPGYVNSYFWEDVPLGEVHDGVRCEDLQALTFENHSLDLVISSDIFEHIREPFRAFAELRRVLKPGGVHVFTVPLGWPLPETTVSRLELDEGGEDRAVLPRVFHSSPTDPQGSLVYTDFGLDLSTRLEEIGYETEIYYGPAYNVTFVARVPESGPRGPGAGGSSSQPAPSRRPSDPSGTRGLRVVHDESQLSSRLRAIEGMLSSARTRRVSQLLSWLVPPTARGLRLLGTYLYLRRSGQFDSAFYLSTYRDVAAAELDPLMHYVEHGWRRGCDPSPSFSTRDYLRSRPDVARAQINPLLHHLRHGDPSPSSDAAVGGLQLNVGAAKTHIPGFVNVDIDPIADVSVDLSHERLPFDDDSVGLVFSHHTLEHIPNYLFALSEIYRVLRHDGVLLLGLPYVTLTEYNLVNPFHHHNFNEHSFDFFDPERLKGSAAESSEVTFRALFSRFHYMPGFRLLPAFCRRWARRHLFNVVSAFDIALVAVKGDRPIDASPARAENLRKTFDRCLRRRTPYAARALGSATKGASAPNPSGSTDQAAGHSARNSVPT